MRILAVIAHPDDLELMAGGAVAQWLAKGYPVHVLTLTDGVWTSPDGKRMRTKEEALAEENKAAELLGYTVENLGLPAMDLQYRDSTVVEILQRIDKMKADTLLCPWDNDQHHDHEMVARMVMAASKRVPRVIMGQINHYLRHFYCPNMFVDITDTWDQKIDALKCFEGQWSRAGEEWYKYLDETTRYYGRIAGVERAEGFITRKFLL